MSDTNIAPPTPALNWRRIAQALLLVVATVVCYLPSIGGGFLWDDRIILLDDPLMKSAAGLWRIWFSTLPYEYYPVDYTSLWMEWHLWGADPLGYRVVNLALHIGSAFLFWRLLTLWRLRGAWFAALLFALHPLNVASVAWIVERKNVLSMVFYLATLVCWTRAEEASTPGRWRTFYVAALIAFALALGSKTSVVMLPCVLLLLAWWRHGRVLWRDVLQTLPFFGLSLAAGIVSLWFQRPTMQPQDWAAALPPAGRAVLLGKSIWFYLGKAFFPHPLVMIYPRWRLLPVHAADFFPLGALLLLGVAAVWLTFTQGWRGPAAALAYFCLSLLPVAGLFHLTFYSLSYVSDHFAYLALLSLYPSLAVGLAAGWESRASRWPALTVAVLLIGICGMLTWQRAADFGSSERLWRHTLALNPDSPAALTNYGLALEEKGRNQQAEASLRRAWRLDPGKSGALTALADLLRREQRWPEAADAYRRLLTNPGQAEDYNNYGVVLLYLGDAPGAAAQFRQALALDSSLFSAHYNLYKLAQKTGDNAAAAAELRVCRQLEPANPEVR